MIKNIEKPFLLSTLENSFDLFTVKMDAVSPSKHSEANLRNAT